MNFTKKNIKIKSTWFEDEENKFKKIKAEGLYLYLNLFKFCIDKQEYEYTFITSISLLRKETGYKTKDIFDLLKCLQSCKIIKIQNLSRWDYLLDKKGEIKEKDVLIIAATDVPTVDENEEDNDYFIWVDLDLMKYYMDIGLSEKYIPLYCLISKLSNGTEKKAYMSIEKMADVLGYNKDFVHKMIRELNRNYLMYSERRKNGKNGYIYEHWICKRYDLIEKFKSEFGERIEKNIKKWDRKK